MDESAAASTQSDRYAGTMSVDDRKSKVNEIVLYLLIADHKKIPIRRADISKNVLKDKEQKGAFKALMKDVIKTLKEVFGIELVEIESKNQKTYMLLNMVDNDTNYQHLQRSPEEDAKMGLLVMILSFIFMNGNIMLDAQLYSSLKKLGVDIDVRHETFGDVKRLLTIEFVRQGYLEHTRQPNTDPPQFEYTWGTRAKLETSKTRILDFVCMLYGDMNPREWKSQYHDAKRTDRTQSDDGDSAPPSGRNTPAVNGDSAPLQNGVDRPGPSGRSTRSSHQHSGGKPR